jgi:hypothetical protein
VAGVEVWAYDEVMNNKAPSSEFSAAGNAVDLYISRL